MILQYLLVGQILWIGNDQLIPVLLGYALILLVWFKFIAVRQGGIALAMTQSVQLVGVYLVFASLILPALVINYLKGSSLLSGYLVVYIQDWPAGAAIAWAVAVFASLCVIMLKNIVNKVSGKATGFPLTLFRLFSFDIFLG